MNWDELLQIMGAIWLASIVTYLVVEVIKKIKNDSPPRGDQQNHA